MARHTTDLSQFAPGLCSAEPDQTAGVIVNVEAIEDADEATGIPMDTSFAPEADVAEATAEVAEAAPDAEQAQTSLDDAQDANDLQEALNSFIQRGNGITAGEQMLINLLVKQSQRRTYRGMPSSHLVTHFSGGLNSGTSGADQADLIAGAEANEKGFKDSVKAFIAKIVDFFKKIYNAIKKWVSGSEKLKSRAEEVKKRAAKSADFAASSSKTVSIGGKATKLSTSDAGNGSLKKVTDGIGRLVILADKVLTERAAISAVHGMATKVNSMAKAGESAKEGDPKPLVSKAADELEAAFAGSSGASGMSKSSAYIGGLQIGVQANLEDFSLTAFAKVSGGEGQANLPTLGLAECSSLADKAIELLTPVIAYQDGWKERDATMKTTIEGMKATSEAGAKGYSEENKAKKDDDDSRDNFAKAYLKKRKIANACGHTLLSVQRTEATMLSHCLAVADAAIAYADASLKSLADEKKGVDKKAEKNKDNKPAEEGTK